jgi:two-component system sensor histidine kinase EvgS
MNCKLICTLPVFLLLLLNFAIANEPEQNEKITLQLHWKYQFEFAGFIAAKEKGFYRDEGLDVEFKEKRSGMDVIDELISERATYAISDASFITKKAQSEPLVLLANYYKRSPQVIVAQQDIFSPYDLQSKTIMTSKSTFNKGSLNSMMKRLKVDTSKIKTVPHTYNTEKFTNGEIDAMTIYLTDQLFELQKAKIYFNIFNPSTYGISSSAVNLITTEDEVKNNSERVERFLRASNKGWQYALENPEEIVDLIFSIYSQRKTKEALLFEAKEVNRLVMSSIYQIGSIQKVVFDPIISNLKEDNIIPESFDFNSMVYKKKNVSFNPELKLSKKEIYWLTEHPVIRVANEMDWPPFDYNELGVPKGFSIDYINLLAKKVGFKVDFVNERTWPELLQLFRQKKIDIMPAIYRNKEREKYTLFTAPYYKGKLGVFTRIEDSSIKSNNNLLGKRIGMQSDVG